MKNTQFITFGLFLILFALVFSCREEDPGPRQKDDKNFSVVDFDRLEVASALDVTVQQGIAFSIHATGDRRNLEDLDLTRHGSTLTILFRNGGHRQYSTSITITMPRLYGADFSGASEGRISGFTEPVSRFDLSLSGASVMQLNINADQFYSWVTGASNLRVAGSGSRIEASVSGASELTAFDYPVDHVKLIVSGASRAKVSASQVLNVSASGASEVLYRGSPQIDKDVSGASSVRQD